MMRIKFLAMYSNIATILLIRYNNLTLISYHNFEKEMSDNNCGACERRVAVDGPEAHLATKRFCSCECYRKYLIEHRDRTSKSS